MSQKMTADLARQAFEKNTDQAQALELICNELKENLDHYDWVGFYFHHRTEAKLILKAFAGEPTEHTEIPFGKGICGQVAESDENFRVDDVNAQENYIACSLFTKSELVVPIFLNGKNIGQIDVDSHQKNAFSKDDEALLNDINAVVAENIKLETLNVEPPA